MRLATFALCLLAVGCGSSTNGDDPSAESTTRPTPTRSTQSTEPKAPKATREPGTRLITAESDYGVMLFDASGQPVYLFDAELGTRPECYGECAEEWPPVLTGAAPQAEGDVRANLLGTTHRTDGRTQATYAGHPLYYYAHEGKYEVLCHNVEEFGGTWLVVRPDGTPAPG